MLSYIVWTCNGNIRSYMSHAYYHTFETRIEAEAFATDHPNCMDDAIPEVEETDLLPPGMEGSGESFDTDVEAYQISQDKQAQMKILLSLHMLFEAKHEWGHTPHWLSAALAAFADGDDAKSEKLLKVAFGTKDAPDKDEWEILFEESRRLEYNDLQAGSRLTPAVAFSRYED